MVNYECVICCYGTKIKTQYIRHLNTKKHINNIRKHEQKCQIIPNIPKLTQNNAQNRTNIPKITHNNAQKRTKTHKSEENLICKYCNKTFSRIDVLTRHINKYCKVKIEFEKEESLKLEIVEHKREKEKLYEYIDKLIDKTGNTNINIEKQMNNTINLNNFGEEDISHITNDFKLKMLSLPYGMIQNMIEKVHFNKKKPENKNIALTNKRDDMIKVFKGDKWKYQNRTIVVDEIIKKNYYRLDDFFEEEGKTKMNDIHSNRYKVFQNKFDNQDNDLLGRIKKDTEMIILSENL